MLNLLNNLQNTYLEHQFWFIFKFSGDLNCICSIVRALCSDVRLLRSLRPPDDFFDVHLKAICAFVRVADSAFSFTHL